MQIVMLTRERRSQWGCARLTDLTGCRLRQLRLLRLMLMLRSSWVCWDDMMMKLQARAAAYLLPVEG